MEVTSLTKPEYIFYGIRNIFSDFFSAKNLRDQGNKPGKCVHEHVRDGVGDSIEDILMKAYGIFE